MDKNQYYITLNFTIDITKTQGFFLYITYIRKKFFHRFSVYEKNKKFIKIQIKDRLLCPPGKRAEKGLRQATGICRRTLVELIVVSGQLLVDGLRLLVLFPGKRAEGAARQANRVCRRTLVELIVVSGQLLVDGWLRLLVLLPCKRAEKAVRQTKRTCRRTLVR